MNPNIRDISDAKDASEVRIMNEVDDANGIGDTKELIGLMQSDRLPLVASSSRPVLNCNILSTSSAEIKNTNAMSRANTARSIHHPTANCDNPNETKESRRSCLKEQCEKDDSRCVPSPKEVETESRESMKQSAKHLEAEVSEQDPNYKNSKHVNQTYYADNVNDTGGRSLNYHNSTVKTAKQTNQTPAKTSKCDEPYDSKQKMYTKNHSNGKAISREGTGLGSLKH